MTVSGEVTMEPVRLIRPGVHLYSAVRQLTGDASGGSVDMFFLLPSNSWSGDMWFPLWFSYRFSAAAITLRCYRTSAMETIKNSSYTSEIFDVVTDAVGGITKADIVPLLRFLRKPYFGRSVAAQGSSFRFEALTNTNAAVYTGELWALRIMPTMTDWDRMISELMLIS